MRPSPLTPEEEALAGALRDSRLFDGLWYQQRYGDVARGRLDPLHHYLRLGAALGRAPGPGFDPRAYLAANPDVAAAGVDALQHYLTRGRTEDRPLHPGARIPRSPDTGVRAQISHLRALLETGGCTDAEARLEAWAEQQGSDAALATEVLALWALRRGDGAAARRWFGRCDGGDRLAPLRLMAAALDGDLSAARHLADTGTPGGDLDLAGTWISEDPEARLNCVNAALARNGLVEMQLAPGAESLLDRLVPAHSPAAQGTQDDAPLVSVILAARNAARTLPTALDAVLRQSWRALELLVVDDASTDATAAIAAEQAARDPRLRLIQLTRNRGAYGARNAGLAQARGHYITLHDADDWAHPERLARQVAYLRAHGGATGCLSTQARVTSDLKVSRWTGTGALIHENMSSLMLSTELIRDTLGGWDRVRVSADSELLRRVRRIYGDRSVPLLSGGPLVLQRDGIENATRDPATGMGWFYYGARREYHEAQLAHHARAVSLRYDPDGPRPFPAPAILAPEFDPAAPRHLDHVYAGLLSLQSPAFETLLDWLDTDAVTGRRVGLVPLYGSEQPVGGGLAMHPALRARIDGDRVVVLCFGETIEATHMRFLPGQDVLARGLRYLPVVRVDGKTAMAPAPSPQG